MDAESGRHGRVSAAATVAAFSVGVLLIAGVCALLSNGQRDLDVQRLQEARALMLAQSLAALGRQSELNDATAEQAFIQALPAEVPGFREAFVLKGTQYYAHSDAAKSGKRLDRNSLSDKELYDKSRRVQKAYDENRATQAEATGVTSKVATDLEVDGLQNPVVAAVPVVAGDRVAGMAQAGLDATSVSTSSRELWLVGVAVIAAVAMAFVTFVTPGFALYAAILLIALVVIASQQILGSEQRANYLSMVESRARLAAGLGRALDAAGASMSPEMLAVISVDDEGVPYGDLRQVNKTEPAAGSQASISLADQYGQKVSEPSVQDGPSRVAIGREAIKQIFDQHSRTLRWLALGVGLLALGIFLFVFTGLWGRTVDTVREHAFAYAYTIPALVGMALLVFIPFTYGIVLGFMQQRYNKWTFVGLDNFIQIVSDFSFQPRNFYFTLVVTVMWTVINVALHVCIGLGLALLLQDKMLKMKAAYRVLLVIPWAVPNYITALIWQGMFHKEFGAINHYLGYLGVEPISWFGSFWTAFAANVATNTWLGFPFMMVISLGALQSIPTDLYEAADVDGASKFQQFRAITLPLLKPALFPAIILGTIWTFNQFNIIYLVSAGQPANSTDILIVEAYRKAFENYNYGGSAAYSTIIFVILLGYTLVTNRWTKATAGAFE